MKMLSGRIMRLRDNALRLWREHWELLLLAVVTLVVFIASIQMWIWGSELLLYQKFDLTLKIIGGLLALGAVYIAFRRTRNAEKGQYSDRFAKAVEQIASDQLAIRLGGLDSIEALSKETEDEFIRVWTYLGKFLRYPPELAQSPNKQGALGRRPDIATVATMLHDVRNKTHLRWIKGNQLPLSYANLQGARLFSANLQDADLQGANLQGANLQRANLQDANLSGANLQRANLSGANLQRANLFYADLQDASLTRANLQRANLFDAHLQDANLSGANLQGANLSGANLQGANLARANLLEVSLHKKELQQLFSEDDGMLNEALFSLDVLKKALDIKDLIPEKMADVCYDVSDGPLPDNWPDDKPKPQPNTSKEWWRAKKNY